VPAENLSRRGLLLAGAGGLLLAACGGRTLEDRQTTDTTAADDTEIIPDEHLPTDDTEAGPETDDGNGAMSGVGLARLFGAQQPVGTELRLPLLVTDADGTPVPAPPSRLGVRVGADGGELGRSVWVDRHDQGVAHPYYPLRTTFDDEGAWRLVADSDGTIIETVVSAVAPTEAAVVGVGDRLPRVATPTRRDGRGIAPVCTADPPCPLHEVSLDAALGAGRPVALLVTSPGSCGSAVCASAIDLLVEARRRGLTAIHAEASTDGGSTPTPVARALDLTDDLSLFLAGADGTVAERLDHIFDRREMRLALQALRS
jgi:hypothetical protein